MEIVRRGKRVRVHAFNPPENPEQAGNARPRRARRVPAERGASRGSGRATHLDPRPLRHRDPPHAVQVVAVGLGVAGRQERAPPLSEVATAGD